MGVKSEALKVLGGVQTLADSWAKAKGKPMEVCSISQVQLAMLEKAVETKKLEDPALNLDAMEYRGITLKVVP